MNQSEHPKWLVCFAGFSERVAASMSPAVKAARSDTAVYWLAHETHSGGSRAYSKSYVEKFVRNVFLRVFLEAKSPAGFCDHLDRSCRLKGPCNSDCQKGERHSCGKRKPSFIVVIYADEDGKEMLLSRVFNFAFCYGVDRGQFLSEPNMVGDKVRQLLSLLKQRRRILKEIEVDAHNVDTPLLLPVRNFKGKRFDMASVLKQARDLSTDFSKLGDELRRLWRRQNRGVSYVDRRDLHFRAAVTAQHGKASIADNKADDCTFGLSTFYRLGIPFYERLQFDVSRVPNGPLGLAFECVKIGGRTAVIHDNHVNIYPNDVVG